ncbi:MAG TPA: hypothetical protein VL966_05765 [Alphaproteobacteria bacterium]|jgi:hypothetical protein|nr:hypothetical protein [Alphaproteobacteria bacterium]
MGLLTNALVSFLRAYRSSLIVAAIGIAALAFIANDARNQRMAAGIDDDCAQAQFMMRMFPMTRCFSIEDIVNMHRGDGSGVPTPNDIRHARSAEKSNPARSGGKQWAATPTERPRGPDYVYGLLQGWDWGEEDKSPADDE